MVDCQNPICKMPCHACTAKIFLEIGGRIIACDPGQNLTFHKRQHPDNFTIACSDTDWFRCCFLQKQNGRTAILLMQVLFSQKIKDNIRCCINID